MAWDGLSARALAIAVFRDALAALDTRRLAAEAIVSPELGFPGTRPITLLGAGKAAVSLAAGVLDVFGARIERGVVVTKDRHVLHSLPERVTVLEASHPVPDHRSAAAGVALLQEA